MHNRQKPSKLRSNLHQKQKTEEQIPDSIEVAQLNAEIQNRVVNGEEPSTDRVEYVDVNGNLSKMHRQRLNLERLQIIKSYL